MRASSAFVCTSLVVAAASLLLLVDVSVVSVSAHGSLTWPPSNRQGGTLDSAGICSDDKGDCFWFSQIVRQSCAHRYRTVAMADANAAGMPV